jgi:hypothetical protein
MSYICYANPTPSFEPAMRLIAAITNANPAQVTTTFNHEYVTGTIVRLKIPESYGMVEANNLTGGISVIDNLNFTINIDTTLFTPFALNPVLAADPHNDICPQVIPIGENSLILSAAEQNVLPR